MSQNLQKFANFQKFQLANLVDFEKCCKTHIFLQKSVPIQPKTNNIFASTGIHGGIHGAIHGGIHGPCPALELALGLVADLGGFFDPTRRGSGVVFRLPTLRSEVNNFEK